MHFRTLLRHRCTGVIANNQYFRRPIMIELDEKYDSYFNESGLDNVNFTSLAMGTPGPDTLKRCAPILAEATAHRMKKEIQNANLFQYGPSMGDWDFRFNLAKFLSEKYEQPVKMKNLMLTCGASHGLYLTASLMFSKGDVVFVEDPTYFIALKVLMKDLQMDVVPISMNAEGISIQELEQQLLNSKLPTCCGNRDSSSFRGLLYIVPAFHNPLGITYSEERCIQIIAVAKKYNLLVFCDDVYNLLNYTGQAVKPLFYYDDPLALELGGGNVISNCTFSKIFGPGMRLGWIQSSEMILDIYKKSGVIESGGGVNNCLSGIMSSVMELGSLSVHLDLLKSIYKSRMAIACKILREQLPEGCSFLEPKGGYFIWITLPSLVIASQFSIFARDNFKVLVQAGDRFSSVGNFQNCIRIAISFHEEQRLTDGVQQLCKALTKYLSK